MKGKEGTVKKCRGLLGIGIVCLFLSGISLDVRAENEGTDQAGTEDKGLIAGSIENSETGVIQVKKGIAVEGINNAGTIEIKERVEMLSGGSISNSKDGTVYVRKGAEIDFGTSGREFTNNGTILVEEGGKIDFKDSDIYYLANMNDGEIVNRGEIRGKVHNFHQASFAMESGSVSGIDMSLFDREKRVQISGGTVEGGMIVWGGAFVMDGGTINGPISLFGSVEGAKAEINGGTITNRDGEALFSLKRAELLINGGSFSNEGSAPFMELPEDIYASTIEIGGNVTLDGKSAPVLKANLKGKGDKTVLSIKDGAKLMSECGDGTVVIDGICDTRTEQPLDIHLEGGTVTNEREGGNGAAFDLGEFSGEEGFSDLVVFDLAGAEVKVRGDRVPVVYRKDGSPCSEVPGCRSEYHDGYTYLVSGNGEAMLMLPPEDIEMELLEELVDVSGNEISLKEEGGLEEGADPGSETNPGDGLDPGSGTNLEESLNPNGGINSKEGLKPDGGQDSEEGHNADGEMPPVSEALPGEEQHFMTDDLVQKGENTEGKKDPREKEEIREAADLPETDGEIMEDAAMSEINDE